MKGLLVKDFRLLKVQKNFFLLLIAIGIGMSMFSNDILFVISFLTCVISMFTLSTISYDEFDNGNAFLFSLPITRTGYVLEKYCFGLILGVGSWIFSILLAIIAGVMKRIELSMDVIIPAFMVLLAMILILAVMLPIHLKFGGEKGRILIVIVIGLMAFLGSMAVKMIEVIPIDLISLFNKLHAFNMGVLVVCSIAMIGIVVLLSMRISFSIMKKKEF